MSLVPLRPQRAVVDTTLDEQCRRRAALVVANDGRPQVLCRSAELAGEILRST